MAKSVIALDTLPVALQAAVRFLRHHQLLDAAATKQFIRRWLKAGQPALREFCEQDADLAEAARVKVVAALAGAGDVLDNYELLAHLATGSMGRVWLATRDQQQVVVLKILHASGPDAGELQRRFVHEAQQYHQLRNNYVMPSLGYGRVDQRLYQAFPLMSAGDLQRWLLKGPLLAAECQAVLRHCGHGLRALLKAGMVHRGMKPQNIFITAQGRACLADFGLLRNAQQDEATLTMSGASLGTPEYLAPEQILGDAEADIRSDIYSLGAVAHFMLTGRPPFHGSATDVIQQHLHGTIPNLLGSVPGISEGLQEIMHICLAKDPSKRFQTPDRLLAALATLPTGQEQDPQQTFFPAAVAGDAAQQTLFPAPRPPSR